MSNSYYVHATYPTPNSPGSSANLRNELELITDGFDKLPVLTGNPYKVVMVNSAGTALLASAALQSLAITSSTINSTPIGAVSPSTGAFTTVSASSGFTGNLTGNLTGNVTGNVTGNITGQITSSNATITGGTINGTVIGGSSPQAITGTTITANTGFSGDLTGDVTGNLTGAVTGPVTGAVTGDLTGNVSASSGTSTFNNVTINGTLNMDAATSATIENLSAPVNNNDATTKIYVDTADNLKLNKSGGTMTGVIAMSSNKITGLADPTLDQDAATKLYVDAAVDNLIDSAPGALDTLNELAAALGDDANFSTTITNSLATKLPLAGGTMTGAIAMGTSKITGMGDPTANQDAATKIYVDAADDLKLNLSGGTLSGALALGTNKITGLGEPVANQDAATKYYVDTQRDTRLALAGGTMSGAIAMGTNKITGAGNPTDPQDLATKSYIDTLFGSTSSAASSAADAALSESNAATSEANALQSENNASTSESNALSYKNSAEAAYDSFDDRYLGAKSSAPSLDNDGDALVVGALYFDTTTDTMKVYGSGGWVAAGSAVNGTADRFKFTATASQTTFTGADDNASTLNYDAGYLDVYLNGVRLVNGTDFTATNGTSIVLATGATANDILEVVAFGTFALANFSVNDANDVNTAGATSGQALTWNGSNWVPTTVSVPTDIGSTVQAYDSNLTSFVGAFTLPTSDGTSGQVIQTNGSGTLSFVTPVTTGKSIAMSIVFGG